MDKVQPTYRKLSKKSLTYSPNLIDFQKLKNIKINMNIFLEIISLLLAGCLTIISKLQAQQCLHQAFRDKNYNFPTIKNNKAFQEYSRTDF